MAQLDTTPGSISGAQKRALFAALKRKGMGIDDLRDLVGGSISKLSKADASRWIAELDGGDLPNPPGEAPQEKRRPQPGNVRLITEANVEQIIGLGTRYFETVTQFEAWLVKNFKVPARRGSERVEDLIRKLGTAQRAGEVIHVLRTMRNRNQEPDKEIPRCDG